jgi:hypothetical protein
MVFMAFSILILLGICAFIISLAYIETIRHIFLEIAREILIDVLIYSVAMKLGSYLYAFHLPAFVWVSMLTRTRLLRILVTSMSGKYIRHRRLLSIIEYFGLFFFLYARS